MPVDPKRVQAVFLAAADQASPADRAALLARECGEDADLRQRVEALLQAHDQPQSFLNVPAADFDLTSPIGTAAIGTQIGPYKLLQQIGEGGFGIVFMAEQTEPVRRRVALKVIKPGMDTRQVIARFEAERQALAVMDHPNIAKVLDAGTIGEPGASAPGGPPPAYAGGSPGRPYFVMELVRGTPITRYCDENSLSIRERLELFATVCQAIQHAHTKGIIHRDIKPTNVLVTRQDGQPVVKVIDFGIAKAMGQQLTDKTLFTDFAQMIGTPLYMSPEQAELSSNDIDTRSDIYSLGVLLYELLTGSTPVSKDQLKAAAFDEIRRIIREDEPPKPSTRISSAEAAPSIAAQRHTEPAKLTRLVRGELDWIVMKALEKDRNRRYETASGFAADVERYLADEPVLACPPSALYRFRKFARRNQARLLAGGTVAVAVLVITTVVAASLGWRQFRHAKLNHEVELAIKEATQARDRALTLTDNPYEWDAALAAANSAVKSAARIAAQDEAAFSPTLKRELRSLQAALEADLRDRQFADRFDAIRLEQSELNPVFSNFKLANAYPAIGQALDDFYQVRIGTTPTDEAKRAVLERPLPIQQYLVATLEVALMYVPPGDADAQAWLKNVLASVDTAPWRQRARQAVDAEDWQALESIVSELAAARQPAADLLRYADRAPVKSTSKLAMLRHIRQTYPADFWANHQLANTLQGCQPPQLDEAIRYYQAAVALRPQSAAAALHLANALRQRGSYEQALAAYQDALRLGEDNALAHVGMGWTLLMLKRQDEALTAMHKAIRLRPAYAIGYCGLSSVLEMQKKFPEAAEMAREAVRRAPKDPNCRNVLGNCLLLQGLPAEAEREQLEAIRLDRSVATYHVSLGRALAAQQKFKDAEQAYLEAIRLDPDHARAHEVLGWLLITQQRYAEAEGKFREVARLKPCEANLHFSLGRSLFEQRKFADAEAALRLAILLDPAHPYAPQLLARVLAAQGKPKDEAPATPDKGAAEVSPMSIAKGTRLPPAEGFTPLFNGKDLTGWAAADGGTGMWKIEDGALTCTGPRDHLLTTRNDFGDFHLRAELKINANGNSGIYFRTGKPLVLVGDYEAQITDNPGQGYKTGSLYGLVRLTESPVPPETWFTYEIIAVGQRIRVLVNGTHIADYTESRAGRNTKGHIALQHHDPETRVFFRKIEIKELVGALREP